MPEYMAQLLERCKAAIDDSEFDDEPAWSVYHNGRDKEDYTVHEFDFVRLDGGIYKDHLDVITGFVKFAGYGSWFITKRNGKLCIRASIYNDKEQTR